MSLGKTLAAGLAATAGLAIGAEAVAAQTFFNIAIKRGGIKTEQAAKWSGTDWEKYMPFMEKGRDLLMSRPHEEVEIKSYDGLTLRGTYFPPDEGTGRKKAVICFHGYTGEGVSNWLGYSGYYLKRGFGMLIPDARAHGKSDGEYIGFGILDRYDACAWAKWLAERENSDIDIVLHGVSMGGATVLMASGMPLPAEVKGIISDCAFTSPKEVFEHMLPTAYHLPPVLVLPAAGKLCKKKAGYDLDDVNARNQVAVAKVPILFIHGTEDNFVPFRMLDSLYNSCTSEKLKLVVKGANHAESYYKDTEAYEKKMDELMELAGIAYKEA